MGMGGLMDAAALAQQWLTKGSETPTSRTANDYSRQEYEDAAEDHLEGR